MKFVKQRKKIEELEKLITDVPSSEASQRPNLPLYVNTYNTYKHWLFIRISI